MSKNFGCVLRNLVELLVIGGFGRPVIMIITPRTLILTARSMIMATMSTTTSVFAPLYSLNARNLLVSTRVSAREKRNQIPSQYKLGEYMLVKGAYVSELLCLLDWTESFAKDSLPASPEK